MDILTAMLCALCFVVGLLVVFFTFVVLVAWLVVKFDPEEDETAF